MSLPTGPGGYLPSPSVRRQGAGSAAFLHSSEAQVAILLGLEEPPGEGWSQGWKNWSSCPPPHQPGVLGEGVSRNWRFPTFHTGWEWEEWGRGRREGRGSAWEEEVGQEQESQELFWLDWVVGHF